MEQRSIKLRGQEVNYALVESFRARHLRLSVQLDGFLVATKPWGMGEGVVEAFLLKKASWIFEKLEYMKRFGVEILKQRDGAKRTRAEFEARKQEALAFVESRVEFWNRFYSFPFRRVTVRNQKSRWGSCSRKGNLSFNYRILFLPPSLSDYLIVHELCHLKEFNHSRAFWDLVSRTLPDCRTRARELRALKIC